MTKYLWTGEYRPPKKDEWYLESLDEPVAALIAPDEMAFCRWILHRVSTDNHTCEKKGE